jgi:hypothetical protein
MSTTKEINLIDQAIRSMQVATAKLDKIPDVCDASVILAPLLQERGRIQFAIRGRKISTLTRLLEMFLQIHRSNEYPLQIQPGVSITDSTELILSNFGRTGKLTVADFVDTVPYNFWRSTCNAIIGAISITLKEEMKLYHSQVEGIDEIIMDASKLHL